MKYRALLRNNRVVYIEEDSDFLTNLGLYLYFSQTAKFLTIESFESENLPIDYYNFSIQNNKLVPIESINEEHISPIIRLNQDLECIRNASKNPSRIMFEVYGNSDICHYINNKLKNIAERILANQELTSAEQSIFNYEKSKYDNVDNEKMANMILAQNKLWESRLDYAILEMLRSLDKNLSGGV
jgi:hypothetical protein